MKNFVGFLGNEKTRLFAFEIYWPLVDHRDLEQMEPKVISLTPLKAENWSFYYITVHISILVIKSSYFFYNQNPNATSESFLSQCGGWIYFACDDPPLVIRILCIHQRPWLPAHNNSIWQKMPFLTSCMFLNPNNFF